MTALGRSIAGITIAALLAIGVSYAQSNEQEAMAGAGMSSAYVAHCAACHGRDLGGAGSFGGPLKGPDFRRKWGPDSDALALYISQKMPLRAPGSLGREIYAQITRYIERVSNLHADTQGARAITADNTQGESGQRTATVGPSTLVPGAQNYDAQYLTATQRREHLLARMSSVSEDVLRQPMPQDWLAPRRTDDGFGFSPLEQINRGSVSDLTLAWSLALPVSGTNGITPLVHDGVMFLDSNGSVLAIDARAGDVLWRFDRPTTSDSLSNVSQPRSLAVFEDRLYVPTADGHMLALAMRSGKLLWDHTIGKTSEHLQISAGPLLVRGRIIQGMSGCAGVNRPGGCYIVALDARSGTEIWRFDTIQKRGQDSVDTWNGAPDAQRFGASVWSSGSYDADNQLAYFGTGQTYHIGPLMEPAPVGRYSNAALYTDSTLALNPDTGKLVWHYQHLKRDVWDMDWAFERQIIRLPWGTGTRKVVATMGKLGVLDVVDARTGGYIYSYNLGFQNLVTAIDSATGLKTTDPALEPDPTIAKHICPYATGVRNWPATSYDPAAQVLYVPFINSCMKYRWRKGEDLDISFEPERPPGGDGNFGGVAAINLATRQLLWSVRQRAPAASAALATGGGLVFAGARDRWFRAFDSGSGGMLWSKRLDNVPSSTPVSFGVDGVQYVAVITGGGNYNDLMLRSLTPELEMPPGGGVTLWVFRLAH